ncbi:hypothetical protein Sango_1064400 [Sesamum angolense]|uniref:RNase H type-1 domain-containing protein n=1 Tax=Sesamum angolense TaxID=2727404 RepID=A0AAE1X0U1_9LAMI|nr:hypothetical protein Sango_1064400 [Sesamum angolense]
MWISSIVPKKEEWANSSHEALSFMDGSSGYNQIRMESANEESTAFRTPKKRENHFHDLRKVFERLRRYQLKMNPSKCAFGVTSRKFLGFIIRQRGIEIEQAKIDVILRMPEPRNIHELKSLQGKLAYLRRFISNLVGRCQPFNRLMKKDIPFQWDEACDKAFKSIKSYLMKPPVLVAPVPGRPLILYITAQERPANPLKYVMTKLVLSDRLARWYLQLQQFEIAYVPQKAIKGQVLADFLADHPMPAEWELSDYLPDEDVLVIEVTPPWRMYFDGASHKEGVGTGVVFVTSEGEVLPYSFTLTENCSNNVVEYQAQILGLEIVVDAKQLPLKVYGDSQLLVNQLLGDVELKHLPRKDNKQADVLAKLASTLSITDKEARIPICKSWIIPPIFSNDEDDMFQEEENHVTEVFEVEEEDWRQPLVDYLKYGKLPNDLRQRTDTRLRASRFIYYKGTLYRQ